MRTLPDELRLLFALILNIAVVLGAFRFVRRQGIVDGARCVVDTALTWYAIQYVAVGLAGLAGVLTPAALAIVALGQAGLLQLVPAAGRVESNATEAPETSGTCAFERLALAGALVILCAFIGALIWIYRAAPATANDSLTYHLPAAAEWLQRGRIGLYETWFYNPANAWSPLAGSMFAAWLIAPMGNDVMARFVAAPPLVLIFFSVVVICRALRVPGVVAALVALAACCARPMISQTILAKDDLFLTAFALTSIAAAAPASLSDRLGSWRLGAALGLMFATKYTALFTLPMLLLAVDAPRRAAWGWKRFAIALGTMTLLAAPWYVRNAVLSGGNPLYPMDINIAGTTIVRGMFTAIRSQRLDGLGNVWSTFTAGYYSMHALLWVGLLTGWLVAIVTRGRAILHDPILRVVILGAALSIGLFVLRSPYAETRFVYPAIVMMFVAGGVAIALLPTARLRIGLAFMLAAGSIGTSFVPAVLAHLWAPAALFAMAGALIVLGCAHTRSAAQRDQRGIVGAWSLVGALAILGVALWAYVYWPSYLREVRATSTDLWETRSSYGPIAAGWRYVGDELPPGDTIAYTNTYFTYPLMGFNLDRPVVYVPTRRDVARFAGLPRFSEPTTGEDIPRHVLRLTLAEPDREQWLEHLRASGARWLFVARDDIARPGTPANPPEIGFIDETPGVFEKVFDNGAAAVFRVRGDD